MGHPRNDDWMAPLAELTGLRHFVPKAYAVAGVSDTIIGVRDGYVVALGLGWGKGGRGGRQVVRLFVRFRPTSESAVIAAVEKGQGKWQGLLEGDKFSLKCERSAFEDVEVEKESEDRELEAAEARTADSERPEQSEGSESSPDSLSFDWKCGDLVPSPEKVSKLLDAVIHALNKAVPPLPQICEICKKAPVSEIALCDGTPGYYCHACQERKTRKFKRELAKYEARSVNYARGLAFGLVSAGFTAMAAGFAGAEVFPHLSAGAVGVILVVTSGVCVLPGFLATKAGLNRIDDKGATIILAMCLFAMFGSHVFYYIFLAWHLASPQLSPRLFTVALSLFLDSKVHIASLIFCLFLALIACVQGGLRHALPKPDVTFEPIQLGPAERQNARGGPGS